MPKLKRVSDGEGYHGSLVEAITWNDDGSFKIVANHPVIGCSLRVGSPFAGTYSTRDWWMTTEVTEILEESKNKEGLYEYVKFKTKNSIYEMFG